MGMDTETGRRFFTRNGQRILHLEKHQDLAMEFHYCHAATGREFDVRDLPPEFLGARRDDVVNGDRAAHREVITAAIDAGYDFDTSKPYLPCAGVQPEAAPGDAFQQYRSAFGKLFETIADCIKGGRLTEADLPDDLMAIKTHVRACAAAEQMLDSALKASAGSSPFQARAFVPGLVVSDGARNEIADLLATAADRYKDTLENPLEAPHYSEEDLSGMKAKRDRALYWASVFAKSSVLNPATPT